MFIILFIWLKWIEQYSWGNIAQVKTLFNVAWEVPDNIALAKIMCNIVLELMLLGHHCTGKNPWLCCPRLQTTIHRKKSCSICLHPLGTLYKSNRSYCNVVQGTPDNITQEKNTVKCYLYNIWSLFNHFYFGPVSFLITVGCCKWNASKITRAKSWGPTLNNKTR